MSKRMLYSLNGTNNGAFRRWLDNFKGEPRIAWYPSAGEDFRDLLYLHPKFSEIEPTFEPEPESPDIFLHTDYFPWPPPTFLDNRDNRTIHEDDHTKVSVISIEELPACNLPLDNEIVDFVYGGHATGRVLFLEVEIQSDTLGNFNAPVIYAFVENAAFCAKKILPNKGRLSHIIHVRFGGGLGGGGKSTGIWLLNILQEVGCEVFVSDGSYDKQTGDERIYRLYPDLSGNEDTTQLEQIRVIESRRWSGHGDVTWNLVKLV